jgi:hypothetical protein
MSINDISFVNTNLNLEYHFISNHPKSVKSYFSLALTGIYDYKKSSLHKTITPILNNSGNSFDRLRRN